MATSTSQAQWTQRLLARDPRALARLITLVENHGPGYEGVLDELYPHTGRCVRVGITGPPGAGKSTLVDQLARAYRSRGRTVGVLACDPTSPFSGGALLGDRVRMGAVADDPGVFIRSVASRGALGGLSQTADEVALLFEAFGFDLLLLETVGVGQAEVDVVQNVESVVVVLVPQSGDVVQAMKAGLMEIADVFCLNKSDQPGADQAEQSLQQLLGLATREWVPPVVQTVASRGQGVEELGDALQRHQAQLGVAGRAQKRAQRLQALLRRAVEARLRQELWNAHGSALLDQLTRAIFSRQTVLSEAVRTLLRTFDP